jgi:hypothetical protein
MDRNISSVAQRRRELVPFTINKSSDGSQLERVDLRWAASRFIVANASRLSVSGVEINDGFCLLDLPWLEWKGENRVDFTIEIRWSLLSGYGEHGEHGN